jgi:hypothetical protein
MELSQNLSPGQSGHDIHALSQNLRRRGDSRGHSLFSYRSLLSILSASSVLSVASAASLLSIGSFASILSIGSSHSVLSVGSDGGFLSIGGRSRRLAMMSSREASLRLPTAL